MAEIRFTELSKARGERLDGIRAEFDGKAFELEFYPGDTRTHAVKVTAVRKYLAVVVEKDAIKGGRPPPTKEGVADGASRI